MRFLLKGEFNDLKVYISEKFPIVTPENATWIFEGKKSFSVFPHEQQQIVKQKQHAQKDSKHFQRLFLLFTTSVVDRQLNVQVTFPDEEIQVQRRQQAEDQLTLAAVGPNSELKMSNNLLRAAYKSANNDLDGLTMEEREEQAEQRFRAIANQVGKHDKWSRWQSKRNFVEENLLDVVVLRPEDKVNKYKAIQD